MRTHLGMGLASVVAAIGLIGPAASAAAAGSISGTAVAAGSGAPISGLSVCAEENYVGGVFSGCTATDASGRYAIGGLPAGSNYQVEFSSTGELNFLTQYYRGKEGLGNWDPVTVTDGTSTERIDAVMNPGAQISGRATEEGTGAPAAEVEVCVLDPAPTPRAEEFERCADTGATGDYTVRSLPAGTYVVVFARYRPPVDSEKFGEIYYAGAATETAATPISIAPPETRAGVDATLVDRLRVTVLHGPPPVTLTRHHGTRVGFRFSAQAPVANYLCRLDNRPWRRCTSPQRFWAPIGRHAFQVRAADPGGSKGPVSRTRFRIARRAVR
jgi:hypothetical protein